MIKKLDDGTVAFEKLPLSTKVGNLLTPAIEENPTYEQFDQLGLGVTLYFKMIKVMIVVMILCSLLALPYMLVFKSGKEANMWTANDKVYGSWSLGNIGQNLDMCVKQDINNCDTVDIICPENTEMKELREFGMEKRNDGNNTSVCPATVANATSIKLNLVESCSLGRYVE